MDYNNNHPSWDGSRPYTSLLMQASCAPPIEEGCASVEDTNLNDPHVNAFGVDNEDDMDQSEEDTDDVIVDFNKVLTEEAPNLN